MGHERAPHPDQSSVTEQSLSVSHTPGPWRFVADEFNRDNQDALGSICSDGADDPWYIATIEMMPRCEANARLIAAAPEMLEALQAVTPLMIPGMNWTDETGQLIKRMVLAALAKALGNTAKTPR